MCATSDNFMIQKLLKIKKKHGNDSDFGHRVRAILDEYIKRLEKNT